MHTPGDVDWTVPTNSAAPKSVNCPLPVSSAVLSPATTAYVPFAENVTSTVFNGGTGCGFCATAIPAKSIRTKNVRASMGLKLLLPCRRKAKSNTLTHPRTEEPMNR